MKKLSIVMPVYNSGKTIEEVTFRKGFIALKELEKLSLALIKIEYGRYLKNIVYCTER